MIQRAQRADGSDGEQQPKWFNSAVTYHKGTLMDLRDHLPSFERRSFGLTQDGGEQTRLNRHLDTIVRLPFREDKTFVPVGVVSKGYTLVPHTSILDAAADAIAAAKIAPSVVNAELKLTEYGERMALSLYLPDAYQFDPGDGHPMALRLECMNSVDGSTRFRALMGWFRFVCSNGLIIGVTHTDMRRRHVGDFRTQDIGEVLSSGIEASKTEKMNLEKWRKTPVSLKCLGSWADNQVRKRWGFKAATRAFHIAQTGSDVGITGKFTGSTPTTIAVQAMEPIPGAPEESRNLYDVSQILAWLAKERRDIQEQLKWREQIRDLMESLAKRADHG